MKHSFKDHSMRFDNQVSKFSSSFMNDSKWTRLFQVLSKNNEVVKKCFIKDIYDSEPSEIKIVEFNNFSETFNSNGINDVMTGGPVEFKEIEMLSFPKKWKIKRNMRNETLAPFEYHQDIEKIKRYIEISGLYEMEADPENLIIYGYKK